MDTTTPSTSAAAPAVVVPPIPKRRFTVDEYYRMAEVGILTERERVELIDGEIIPINPIGSRHAQCVDFLTERLVVHFVGSAIVRVQGPIRLSQTDEPEPDVSVIRRKTEGYRLGHPTPADCLLIVEVADTSVAFDRRVKIPLYARFEIPEMWLIDVGRRAVEVRWSPRDGDYQMLRTYGETETVRSETCSGLSIVVADLLA